MNKCGKGWDYNNNEYREFPRNIRPVRHLIIMKVTEGVRKWTFIFKGNSLIIIIFYIVYLIMLELSYF
jgi:hypothetical protein